MATESKTWSESASEAVSNAQAAVIGKSADQERKESGPADAVANKAKHAGDEKTMMESVREGAESARRTAFGKTDAERSTMDKAGDKVGDAVESAKEKVHDATE